MYAVVKTGGKQYKVAPGEKLKVETLPADVGAEVVLDQVLMVGEGESVRLGQPVRVTADTYPGKTYDGRISFIASDAEFTPKNVETQKERVKLVYRIKIVIPNRSMELKPGMPADGEIALAAPVASAPSR